MLCAQVNYNLLAVNLAMAATGIAQLTRKIRADYGQAAPVGQPEELRAAKEA